MVVSYVTKMEELVYCGIASKAIDNFFANLRQWLRLYSLYCYALTYHREKYGRCPLCYCFKLS